MPIARPACLKLLLVLLVGVARLSPAAAGSSDGTVKAIPTQGHTGCTAHTPCTFHRVHC